MTDANVPDVPTPEHLIVLMSLAMESVRKGDLTEIFRATEVARDGYERIIKARYRNHGDAKNLDRIRIGLERLEEVIAIIKRTGLRMPDGRILRPPSTRESRH